MNDGGDGDKGSGGGAGEGPGELVAVASFTAAHEAELARTKLQAEGLLAFVWDAATVNADPLLSVAVRGVKVAVPARDAGRARSILGPEAAVFEGKPRPAFRVKGTRSGTGFAIGLVVGVGIAFALSKVMVGPVPIVAAALAAVIGVFIGDRRRADTCSACSYPVLPEGAPDHAKCPHCGLELRATIAHMNDRLAAEEALGEGDDEEPEFEDDDDDGADEEGAEHDDHDDAREGSDARAEGPAPAGGRSA